MANCGYSHSRRPVDRNSPVRMKQKSQVKNRITSEKKKKNAVHFRSLCWKRTEINEVERTRKAEIRMARFLTVGEAIF